jgi:hypothetical protein
MWIVKMKSFNVFENSSMIRSKLGSFDRKLQRGCHVRGGLHMPEASPLQLQLHGVPSHLDKKVQTMGRRQAKAVSFTCQLQTEDVTQENKVVSLNSRADRDAMLRCFCHVSLQSWRRGLRDEENSLGAGPEQLFGGGAWWLAANTSHRKKYE